MKSDEVFLRHMLDEVDFPLKQTRGIDFDRLATDAVTSTWLRACGAGMVIPVYYHANDHRKAR